MWVPELHPLAKRFIEIIIIKFNIFFFTDEKKTINSLTSFAPTYLRSKRQFRRAIGRPATSVSQRNAIGWPQDCAVSTAYVTTMKQVPTSAWLIMQLIVIHSVTEWQLWRENCYEVVSGRAQNFAPAVRDFSPHHSGHELMAQARRYELRAIPCGKKSSSLINTSQWVWKTYKFCLMPAVL